MGTVPLMQHMAPKVLQCQGFSSAPLPAASLIAGDSPLVAVTGNYFKEDYSQIVNDHDDVITNVFADDTAMAISGKQFWDIYNKMADRLVNFKKTTVRLKLT